nr:unnamed protein product [Callosobruchus chinensis]
MLPPDPVFITQSDMGYIHHLNFFQDKSSQLLAATEKGLVYFWDINGQRVSCKKEVGKSIQAIHSYADRIITQERSGTIKLWSMEDFKVIHSYECYGGYCKTITIDDILVVPQENSVDLVDKKDFKKIKTLVSNRKNSGTLMALEWAKLEDGTYILAGFESGIYFSYSLNLPSQMNIQDLNLFCSTSCTKINPILILNKTIYDILI